MLERCTGFLRRRRAQLHAALALLAPLLLLLAPLPALALDPQTITFGNLLPRGLYTGPVPLTATASSALTVGFSSNTPAVCAVSGNAVQLLAQGTCVIAADQAGNATYDPAPTVTRSFDIYGTVAAGGGDFGSGSHTCALKADGTVRCWGLNTYGQLGTGDTAPRDTPVPVPGLDGVTQLSAGPSHTCARLNDNSVRCWGRNNYGQLGNGLNTDASTPVTVSGLPSARAVAVGDQFTCALLTNGSVQCWGYNHSGQLGNGNKFDSALPVSVSGVSTATALAVGYRHACARLADGSVSCWGDNLYGQLGEGQGFLTSELPLPVSGLSSGALSVGVGPYHSCASLANGSAKCWGQNDQGQLGDGNQSATANPASVPVTVANLNLNADVAALAGGLYHSCARMQDSTVRCWGNNFYGQLGDNTGVNSLTSVPVSGLNTVVAMSVGDRHSCAALANGSVRCWGRNDVGQLGTTASFGNFLAPTPVQGPGGVGELNLLQGDPQTITFGALDNRGSGETFTVSATASSGLTVSFSPATPDVCSLSGNTVTTIAAGTCTIAADQSGDATWAPAPQVTQSFTVSDVLPQTITFGSLPARTIGERFIVSATASSGLTVSFSALTGAVCSLDVDGVTVIPQSAGTCTIAADQSGDGTYAAAPRVTQSFTVLQSQTVSITTQLPLSALIGTVFALDATASSGLTGITFATSTPSVCTVTGGNTLSLIAGGTCTVVASQAGDGTYAAASVTQSFVVKATQSISFGALSPRVVNGAAFTVSASSSAALPVTVSSTTTAVCAVSNRTVTLRQAGTCTLRASQGGNATFGEAVPVLRSFTVFSAVAAGASHSCGVKPDGTVRCWGSNAQGQVGNGSKTNAPRPVVVSGLNGVLMVAAGAAHSCALKTNGTVLCWGDNAKGQLGNGTTTDALRPLAVPGLTGIAGLALRGNSSCALRASGGVACWGENASGQLGDGTITNRSRPVPVVGLPDASAIGLGLGHACAVVGLDRLVSCWGANGSGQLGRGSVSVRAAPAVVPGLSDVTSVVAGNGFSCARRSMGEVLCWGANASGQLGLGTSANRSSPATVPGLSAVGSLSAGASYACAISGSGGAARCWGANASGQLGTGTTTVSRTPVLVGSLAVGAAGLAAGDAHTCAMTTAKRVKCWGANASGQIGDGGTTGSKLPVLVGGF